MKKIAYWVAKYDMPLFKKGEKYDPSVCAWKKEPTDYPEVFKPVYEDESLIDIIARHLNERSALKSSMLKYRNEPEVPPGIVALLHKKTGFICRHDTRQYTYQEFVKAYYKPEIVDIHTISVNGVEWSVGEVVGTKYNSDKNVIQRFTYSGGDLGYWGVFYTDGGCDHLTRCVKLPTRKPIVTLQGKDMYEGDIAYHVDYDFEITVWHFRKGQEKFPGTLFVEYSDAKQYVRDNKPVYPAGLVEELLDKWDKESYLVDLATSINKLKAFKP